MGPRNDKFDSNVETYSLVWLDESVHSSTENQGYQGKLRTSINQLDPFDNIGQCFKHVQSVPSDNRIIFICSGRSGRVIVPRIHGLRQIYSIYVFCRNKELNEKWARNHTKVRGVFTKVDEMIEEILYNQHAESCQIGEEIPISIFNGDHLERYYRTSTYSDFIYSQILIDTLLTTPITKIEKNELYSRCRQEYQSNKIELQKIKEFEDSYDDAYAIRWLTQNCFLSKMLIKAFRIQNLDLLFLFRFVIQDIQYYIGLEHCKSTVNVYRSQLMSSSELQKLKDSLHQFISVNCFLLTVVNQHAGRSILNRTPVSDDMQRVLFEIHADGNLNQIKPFTCVKFKANNDPEEILFSIGSIFQLNDIQISQGNIWVVKMTLCTDDEPLLQPFVKDINEQYGPTKTSPYSFGILLKQIQKFDDAKKYYERLIRISAGNLQRIKECEEAIGEIYIAKKNYEIWLDSMGGTIDNKSKSQKFTAYNQAMTYIHNGEGYEEKGNLKSALASYQEAVKILTNSFGERHYEVGRCSRIIASLYEKNQDYDHALNYYEQAKNNLEDNLLTNHPDLSEIYMKIGDMHRHFLRYDEAIENYEKSLAIAEQLTIQQLPLIIIIIKRIAAVYETKKDFRNALAQYQKVATFLPTEQADAVENNQNIERMRSLIQ